MPDKRVENCFFPSLFHCGVVWFGLGFVFCFFFLPDLSRSHLSQVQPDLASRNPAESLPPPARPPSRSLSQLQLQPEPPAARRPGGRCVFGNPPGPGAVLFYHRRVLAPAPRSPARPS